MNSLAFWTEIKEYLLKRQHEKSTKLCAKNDKPCVLQNTARGPTTAEACRMSKATHNGSLVLLCAKEKKTGKNGGRALRPFHKSRRINTRRVDVTRTKKKVSKDEGFGWKKCYFLHVSLSPFMSVKNKGGKDIWLFCGVSSRASSV